MRVSISLDFELGWGVIENQGWVERSKLGIYEEMRQVIPDFLQYLDSLEIPVTFACVGAMVQNPKQRTFSYLPPSYRSDLELFLASAPNVAVDARDLMEKICSTTVEHEIASHSYSHIHGEHPDISNEVLVQEIVCSSNYIYDSWDIRPSSLIYPRDQVYPDSTFLDTDIKYTRVPPKYVPSWSVSKYHNIPSSEILSTSWGGKSFSGSLFLNWGIGKYCAFKRASTQFKASRISQLVKPGNVDFHCWLHPFNLVHTPGLKEWLFEWFTELSIRRDKGECEILTVSQHMSL